MKALILDGGREGDIRTPAVGEVIEESMVRRGFETHLAALREMDIAPCTGCFGCWVRTPGLCVIDDAARELAHRMVQSDVVTYLTPVVFGGYSSELKKALDRSICIVSPMFATIGGEVHHRPRYGRHPRLIAVGLLSHPDEGLEAIFSNLVSRNATNMHNPAWAAGFVYRDDGPDAIDRKLTDMLSGAGVPQ